jgi:hypothetical protein
VTRGGLFAVVKILVSTVETGFVSLTARFVSEIGFVSEVAERLQTGDDIK